MKGKIPEDEVLKDMKAFFKENFSVEIIAYLTDRLNDGRLRVTFLVWGLTAARPYMLSKDPEKDGKIRERFSRASREHDLNRDYLDPDSYFIDVSDFRPDAEEFLMRNIPRKKIGDLLGKYPEVKRHLISGSTIFVFYSTDKEIADNRDKGLSQKICSEISELFDDLAGIKGCKTGDVRFSSLETFEGRYGGNFHGFWLDH